jgi:histo-blood group ABO system transferase
MNIGLLIIATNKYKKFINPLLESADKFFLKNHSVSYFIFIDDLNYEIKTQRNKKLIKVDHKHWPFMTLERYKLFNLNRQQFNEMDYLFYLDVDSLIVDHVDEEILSDLVVTHHHGYYKLRGTPERNKKSTAYIDFKQEINYVCGGFNGGKKDTFLKMSKTLNENIEEDLKNGIIAVWHDESHINKYVIDNKPSLFLSPDYCFHQNHNPPNPLIGLYMFKSNGVKILALSKNANEIRD